jgi:hypothetical protein
MRTLSDKELNLIKLAVYEGIDKISDRLWTDFKIRESKLTSLQINRFNEFEDLLYTFAVEVVEDHGVLQSEYDA